MTREEFRIRYVTAGLIMGGPIYLDDQLEAKRVAWVKWRNRIVSFLVFARIQGNHSTAKANRLMGYVWPFPVGETYSGAA